jgi:hypothetical protein
MRVFCGVDQKPEGCWLACIASITGISLDAFPDVPARELTGDEQCEIRNAVTRVLRANGWQLHHLWTNPPHGPPAPRGWAIAGGESPRHRPHAVVAYDGRLIFDPHPSRAGLLETDEYEVLVPMMPANELPRPPL